MKRLGVVLLGMVMIFGVPLWVAGTEPPAAGAPPISPQGEKAVQVIWTGKSGGFEIRWTTIDIQARPLNKPGRLVFSAARLANRGFQTFISPPNLDGSEEQITYERKFTLLSVVGSIISLRDELYYYVKPSAHPGVETRFTTIDLAKPGIVPDPWAIEGGFSLKKLGQVAKLTDYFPENEVLKALLNNGIIKEALAGESPPSLVKLFELLTEQPIRINEVPYVFPRDFLTRFGFHHLQRDKVAVLMGLPSSGGAARGFHAELSLLLPVPPTLKKSLPLGASGKEGFLMTDRKKIAGEGVTLISFSIDGKGKVK
ncbi:MAG: hypothetical protein NTY36_00195 [Deltaproteobacteria bacterium]|nr:hypothetical protein [Deltaproteobacteria bacterium]